MIYIASPYSHPDPQVRQGRYLLALHYSALLLRESRLNFSPIVYGYNFQQLADLGGDYLTWKKFNDFMLSQATEMHVLCVPGWRESAGVNYEIAFARTSEIPYRLIEATGTPT